MTEQGRVVKFDRSVKYPDGSEEVAEVTRVGIFNLVSNGKYLRWNGQLETVAELAPQPAGRFQESAAGLESITSGFAEFGLDPSRGSILELLIQVPSLRERVNQGVVRSVI